MEKTDKWTPTTCVCAVTGGSRRSWEGDGISNSALSWGSGKFSLTGNIQSEFLLLN